MKIPVIRKKPAEIFPIGLRYQGSDLKATDGTDVTISSTIVTVSPAGLTLGTSGVVTDGKEVYCWISDGVTDIDYTVRFSSTLSDAKVLVDDYLVKVHN